MSWLRTFRSDCRGTTAAEFALILPVAMLFLFGIVDTGRYAWNVNRLEKAAQMGARYAVATNVIPSGLNAASFAGLNCNGVALTPGDTICKEALGTITCIKASTTVACTCANSSLGAGSCPAVGTLDSTATGPFAKIATRIRRFAPQVGTTASASPRSTYATSTNSD